MTDFATQRLNMVESQVRPSDVTDRRIIKAMAEIPREAFVPAGRRSLAYMDDAVPVAPATDASGPRTLLAPRTLAKLVQAAEIESGDAVLEVGCATGYATGLLAQLARAVVGVECDAALAAQAAEALRRHGVGNAVVIEEPLEKGAPTHAPFDAILINGGVGTVPEALLQQLKDGGRLVGIALEGGVGRAQVWRRRGQTFDIRPLFDAGASLLPGFAEAVEFSL